MAADWGLREGKEPVDVLFCGRLNVCKSRRYQTKPKLIFFTFNCVVHSAEESFFETGIQVPDTARLNY